MVGISYAFQEAQPDHSHWLSLPAFNKKVNQIHATKLPMVLEISLSPMMQMNTKGGWM